MVAWPISSDAKQPTNIRGRDRAFFMVHHVCAWLANGEIALLYRRFISWKWDEPVNFRRVLFLTTPSAPFFSCVAHVWRSLVLNIDVLITCHPIKGGDFQKIHHRQRSFSHAFQARATEGIRTGHLKGISATQHDENKRWNESQRNLRPALAPWSYFGNHLLPGCIWKIPAIWSPWAVFCRTQRRSLVLQGRLEPCLRSARRALLQGHFQALYVEQVWTKLGGNVYKYMGNREVKPIPSEVWSNQALAARMDLFDRAMPLITLHQRQRNLDVRVAMSETVAIGDPWISYDFANCGWNQFNSSKVQRSVSDLKLPWFVGSMSVLKGAWPKYQAQNSSAGPPSLLDSLTITITGWFSVSTVSGFHHWVSGSFSNWLPEAKPRWGIWRWEGNHPTLCGCHLGPSWACEIPSTEGGKQHIGWVGGDHESRCGDGISIHNWFVFWAPWFKSTMDQNGQFWRIHEYYVIM